MAKNGQPLPDLSSISITEQDTKNANKRKSYRPGWYQWLCRDGKSQVSEKKGSLMVVAKVAALHERDNADSADKTTIYNYIVLPLRNPDVKGHQAPNTAGMCGSTFRAMGLTEHNEAGEDLSTPLPDYPRRDPDTGAFMFRGQRIDKTEQTTANTEVTKAVQYTSRALFGDPSKIVNLAFFAELFYEAGSDFPSLRRISENLPDDVALVPSEEFFTEDAEEDESVSGEAVDAAETEGAAETSTGEPAVEAEEPAKKRGRRGR